MLLRPWRLIVGVLVLLVLLVVAWYVYLAITIATDLNAAVDDADRARSVASQGDVDALDAPLADLAEHSTAAADRANGVSWGVLTHLPFVGDDARGVRAAATVASDLSAGGLDDLLTVADQIDALAPQDGRIDVAAVEALQEPLANADTQLQDALATLEAEDSSGYLGRLKVQFDSLTSQVRTASEAVGSANTAAQVLPTMLGADGPRTYLLISQNNAEVRATGGLPGQVSVLKVRNGRIELTRTVAGNSFGRRDSPVLPLTDAEQSVLGTLFGTFFLDANFTPDFQRASEMWTARWEETYPDTPVDGVLSLDTVALSYLMEGMEPVEVDGVELTSDTVVDELLSNAYARYENPADQDRFFAEAAAAIFSRVTSGAVSPQTLLPNLVEAADEGRVLISSTDPEVSDLLAGTDVAGVSLDAEDEDPVPDAPTMYVALNDSTGAKMSYYLRADTQVSAAYCTGSQQAYTVTVSLTSTAPRDAADLPSYVTGGGVYGVEEGNTSTRVQLYSPRGGAIGDVEIDGQTADGDLRQYGDRVVSEQPIELAPGDTARITWRVVSGEDQPGDTRLWVTPTIDGPAGFETVGSACG
ncbi:DUF4012 domain-containing protein [Nocardioides bruguierae]|uniref:DUF4012 domain-containing protein n=1 Tax=Nocardioides bruguierae TaxID=2945102 RepID=UPI002020F427|nr:DUF4012 domain-containing protein [Nocardioides bruguierae]MCL8026253.1 DUF4012 domain-containing protein [Nocardioides bruguierae]